MKNIIITGATSFIGVNLIKELVAKSLKIYAVVRPNSNKIKLLPMSDKITLLQIDMADYDNLDCYIHESCDCLIHLAWNGARGLDRMNDAIQVKNYKCAMKAVYAALHLNCKTIVSAGSQAEYGSYNYPIDENTPCHPNTEYGKQKLKLYEDAMILCPKNKAHFKEPRFFSLYGPGDFEGTMVISILKRMLNNRDCELTECKQMWDFLYIDDAVKGILKLIEIDCDDGVYNFGSGMAKPLKFFIEEMYCLTHSKSKLLYGAMPYPKTGMVSIEPIIDKLQSQTGWHAETSFQSGILNILKTWDVENKNANY